MLPIACVLSGAMPILTSLNPLSRKESFDKEGSKSSMSQSPGGAASILIFLFLSISS